jgi:hypothetical protein
MKIDCRENKDCWLWEPYDKDTGKSLTGLHIIAVDDSTGQIIRYEIDFKGKILQGYPLVSEIRNIEIVYTGWNK